MYKRRLYKPNIQKANLFFYFFFKMKQLKQEHSQSLEKVWKQAETLDNLYSIFGIGIGLGSLAGIVPV